MHEVTRAEILRWQERLEDRDFQRALLNFQKYVYELFESLRRQTGLRLIRGILYRDEVKSLDSIVEKIRRKREEQDDNLRKHPTVIRPYDFSEVRDFVGIKILCPYAKDAETVAAYLFAQSGRLRVVEETPEAGWKDEERGYRGYNFTVYPAPGQPFEWTLLCCEVQIKTMVQEAWDAMTHDLTYKRARAIPDILQQQFAALSESFAAAERQGQLLKNQIEELFAQVTAHRELAAQAFLSLAIRPLNLLRESYPAIPEIREDARFDDRTFAPIAIAGINEALRCERQAGSLNRNLCRIAAFVALCSKEPGQAAYAVQLVNDLVMMFPHSSWAEMLRASIFWALGRFDRSVESAERAYAKSEAEEIPELLDLQSDFCYYASDAKVFHTFVPQATEIKVLRLAETLQEGPFDVGRLDTAGFSYIAFGKDEAAVQDGIALVRRAQEAGAGEADLRKRRLADVFCQRHLHLGEMRLRGQLAWWR